MYSLNMEVPSPPIGLNYNEFRTWRKEQGIKGTKQDLANAWAEYTTAKSLKRSPTRASPRRSPRRSPKSPARYAGLASSSLLGLPKDIGRMVGSKLDIEAVSTMRKTSKATSKLTDVQLEKLCAAPITAKELLNVIDEIPLPFTFEIREPIHNLDRFMVVKDKIITTSSDLIHLDDAKDRLEYAIDHDLAILVAPGAMETVLEHRLSCVKLDPTLSRSIALSALRRYTRKVLQRVVPVKILRGKAVTKLLQGTDTVEAYYSPEDRPLVLRRMLRTNMTRLHFTVDWITASLGGSSFPIGRERWGTLTNEEAQAGYIMALNLEVDRLRAFYRNF